MKVALKALIKQVKIVSLVSGDKEAEIMLRLQDDNVSDDILNSINSLQRADKQVMVVLMDKEEMDKEE